MDIEKRQAELKRLLEERSVTGADDLLGGVEDVEAALGAVAYWDDHAGGNTGLLVWLLRHGGKPGYGSASKPKAVGAGEVTPRLLQSIRGSCNSPNGFTRDEARGMFAATAKRLRMPVDTLIDRAMGEDWQETPTHEALSHDGTADERLARYSKWVAEAWERSP